MSKENKGMAGTFINLSQPIKSKLAAYVAIYNENNPLAKTSQGRVIEVALIEFFNTNKTK